MMSGFFTNKSIFPDGVLQPSSGSVGFHPVSL